MLIILGESASGKTTVQKILCDKYGFERLITYTTRSPRQGEKDGVDYNFITEDQFELMKKENKFCESAVYNGWHYGTATEDCTENKVFVSTPHGLRQLKRFDNLNITSVYINVPRRDRLIKILQRGDDVDESYRRSLSDVGQYDGLQDEIDIVIDNEGYNKSPTKIAEEIMKGLNDNYKF